MEDSIWVCGDSSLRKEMAIMIVHGDYPLEFSQVILSTAQDMAYISPKSLLGVVPVLSYTSTLVSIFTWLSQLSSPT